MRKGMLWTNLHRSRWLLVHTSILPIQFLPGRACLALSYGPFLILLLLLLILLYINHVLVHAFMSVFQIRQWFNSDSRTAFQMIQVSCFGNIRCLLRNWYEKLVFLIAGILVVKSDFSSFCPGSNFIPFGFSRVVSLLQTWWARVGDRGGRQNCPHFRILEFALLADSFLRAFESNFQVPFADQFADDSSLVHLGFPHPLNFSVLLCSGTVKC